MTQNKKTTNTVFKTKMLSTVFQAILFILYCSITIGITRLDFGPKSTAPTLTAKMTDNERTQLIRANTSTWGICESSESSLILSIYKDDIYKEDSQFNWEDIRNFCSKAKTIAACNNQSDVTLQHFESAMGHYTANFPSESQVLNEEDGERMAYHQAGHIVATWFLRNANLLVLKYQDRLCVTLGGRIAEEMFLGRNTTTAQDAPDKTTELAKRIIRYGLSSNIPAFEHPLHQGNVKPRSRQMRELVRKEVLNLVQNALERTRQLLHQRKEEMEKVAQHLLQHKILHHEDLINLLGPQPFSSNYDLRLDYGHYVPLQWLVQECNEGTPGSQYHKLGRIRRELGRDERTAAYHEAGHAVTAWFLKDSDWDLQEVSILERNKGHLGQTTVLHKDKEGSLEKQLPDELCIKLGGQVAEELFLGEVTDGGYRDLKAVTDTAYNIAFVFMFNNAVDMSRHSQILDEKAVEVMKEARQRTRSLLQRHEKSVHKVAERLLAQSILFREEVTDLLGPDHGSTTAPENIGTVRRGIVMESKSANQTTSDTCPTTPPLTKCCGPVLVAQATTHCCGNIPVVKGLHSAKCCRNKAGLFLPLGRNMHCCNGLQYSKRRTMCCWTKDGHRPRDFMTSCPA